MKFSKFGQAALVSSAALVMAASFTACNPVTIDYIFVAGNKTSEIQTFLVDRVSGALEVVNSTIPSGGSTPVSEAVATDYSNLYVANQGDSTIVQFSIDGGGKLTSKATITESAEGNTPVSIAMNAQGTLLYVVNKFQPGCSTATVGADSCNGGALAVFPVSSGALGTAVANGNLSYWPVGVNPTSVAALANGAAAYVSSYDPAKGLGYIYGFGATSAGALTAVPTVLAGVRPVALAAESTNRFVYAVDYAQNQLIGYSVIDTDILHPLINGPFKTGNQPSAITIDPRGAFIYITNQLDNSISAYAIDFPTGTPTAAVNTSGATINSTGTSPVAIIVDPSYGRYVYSANLLDNSLTGFLLNPNSGSLSITQNGPYPSVGAPSALAAIPHGNHSIQVNQP
ncbi:MAG TPA: beta-propeller fold lactonase family protein [Acidobacteriaceae bacterium]|nr:beta-propeller fold lactonase family protein [Acidobacteriaceae bacterium]